eukprot:2729220-Rhodomonas_salina.1
MVEMHPVVGTNYIDTIVVLSSGTECRFQFEVDQGSFLGLPFSEEEAAVEFTETTDLAVRAALFFAYAWTYADPQ